MLELDKQYVRETYNEKDQLVSYEVVYPDTFNFAYDIVDTLAKKTPDERAMVWCNPEGEEHFFTFADMKYYSDKTANVFLEQGLGPNDQVMVILRRHYQFWFCALALEKIGATMIPATFMLKEHDLEYRINGASVSAIICTSIGDISTVVENTLKNYDCPTVKKLFLVNGGGGGVGADPYEALGVTPEQVSTKDHICALPIKREGWIDFNTEIRAASATLERIPTKAQDPLLMYFSSGTSGNPKMVMHDAGYALSHIMTAKHWHNVKAQGLHFTIADTGWGKAVWGKFYGQWIMESAVLTYDFDRFHADEILRLIQKYNVTTLCCPPTMYRLMMQEDIDAFDLSSLIYSTTAGEALNPDIFDFWKEHTGLTIFEGFGQTETPLTIANLTNTTPKPGSMGRPVPAFNLSILRADGSCCDSGETGEICIDITKKPAGIMMEYFRNPEMTTEAMHDGWYHTGDTAWRDEDGYYWYVGRNDDVIKSSGYRIGPFEIESVLLEHEAVRECAVTGVPDPIRGKAVKATIVLSSGFSPSEELSKELQSWVKKNTAPYKYPRIIDYVDSLPRTVNGKIRRVAIREQDDKKIKEGLL